jgi:uncharacterized membrane protein YkvA (DUF1232 family)
VTEPGNRASQNGPAGLRGRLRDIKQEVRALWFAARDPRVPRYARWLGVAVVAYALSPIDLIPDFIPVFGYLDDIMIVPLGLLAFRAMVPREVLGECRARAAAEPARPKSIAGAVIVVAVWLGLAVIVGFALLAW